jgi:hypothetical protein
MFRAYSTPESALNGEITWLAIGECGISIAIYVGIGYYRHTFSHYAWAIAIAPLLLFRTDESSMWALDRFGRFIERFRDAPLFQGILLVILTPFVGIAIRVTSTVYWLAKQPLPTISQMPTNWIRQSLCVDFCHTPEILPLEAAKGDPGKVVTFSEILSILKSRRSLLRRIAALVFALPILAFGYLPPLIYRVSFKATALVYAPFVWVAHTSLRSPLSTKIRLERFTKGEMEKARRSFSVFVLGILVLKLGVLIGWIDISELLKKFPSPKLLNSIPPETAWFLAIDAALTYAMFFFADAALPRLDQNVWTERPVLAAISGGTFVRNTLAILTMAYLFRLAVLEVVATKLGVH